MTSLPALAYATGPLAMHPYAPILVLILSVITMVAFILVISHLIGPRRKGATKGGAYESGMPIIGNARRRFHAHFYIVALLFLLFDVEIIFLWPWAQVFYQAAVEGQVVRMPEGDYGSGFLLVMMGIFLIILLVGYLYELKRGLFKWI
jgi:NADH-quinone oxidoreductase subunit A